MLTAEIDIISSALGGTRPFFVPLLSGFRSSHPILPPRVTFTSSVLLFHRLPANLCPDATIRLPDIIH